MSIITKGSSYILSALSVLCLGGLSVSAQTLSLDSCKQLALEHNHAIEISRLSQQKAKATQRAMRTNYLPKLSARGLALYSTASYQRNLGGGTIGLEQFLSPQSLSALPQAIQQLPPALAAPLANLVQQLPNQITIPTYNLRFNTHDVYVATLNLDQPIYMGGKIEAANRMAKLGLEAADIKHNLSEQDVLLETEQAYQLYIKALQLHKVAQSLTETMTEAERVVSNAVRAGMRTQNDILKVQVKQSEATLKLRQTEHAIELARMNLNQIIGLPLGQATLPIIPSEQTPKLETTYDLSIERRPELALLRKQIDLKEAEKQLVRSEFLPKVGVRGSYTYLRGGELNDQLLLNRGGFSATVSVSVPLWNWGEGRNKVKAADLDTRIATAELQQKSQRMTLELQKAINTYNEMILEVDLLRKTSQQALENERIMTNRYKAGLETTVDYLEAVTLRNKAEADVVDAVARLALSRSALDKAQGILH